MLKKISKIKRFLTAILVIAMLLTNNVGVLEALAVDEQPTTNLELSAMVVVNNDDGVVDAGEKFRYTLQYTVPNLTDSQYTGALLAFTLPDYVVLTTDSNGKYEISGPDFNSVTYNDITKEYTVIFNSPLPMHATNTLNIDMKTNNLVTPDDIVLDFSKNFTFQTQFQEGNKSQSVVLPVRAGTIKTNAKSTWNITKENITENDGYNYIKVVDENGVVTFEVTYRIQVKDLGGVDRLGRLGFEYYQVIDTLPTNLPTDGEAIEIKDVKLVRSTGEVALTDAEYSVTEEDGHPVSITFNTYDVIQEGDTFGVGETSQYLETGDITDTTYVYTVVYPYPPYTTPGDQPEITVHKLNNTAVLNYKLYGEDSAQDSADAQVEIGAYEDNVVKADVSVTKYVQFTNKDPELLDSATANKYNFTGNNAVRFTLFTDEACTKVAYNTTRVPMQNISVGENGVATFEDIRKGTYYIKEVSTHSGWVNGAKVKVVIDDNGTVSYPNGSDVINTASTINAVEFTKTGIDAYGDTDTTLGGATFTLSNDTYTDTATSDTNGRVRFDNVPDGTYTLAETAVSTELANKGYEPSSQTYEITVSGGVVYTPDLSGGNTYKNESTKGILKITKVDAQNNATKLPGAIFEVYGPYDTEAEAKADKKNVDEKKLKPTEPKVDTLKTDANGNAASAPLPNGFYLLVETKAPINYTAGESTVVEVKTQVDDEVYTIKNNPQAKVYFSKNGAEYKDAPVVQELPDTEFEIYNASGERLYGVKDSKGNYTDVSTNSTGREAVTIITRLDTTGISVSNSVTLSPGTYKYKETAVPGPFVAKNEFVIFTVGQVAPSAGSNEWKTTQTFTVENFLEYGQIRIIKSADDGATSAIALNGAVFGVYESLEDANAANADPEKDNRIDTIVTGTHNVNGVLVHGIGYSNVKLDLNKTYYVREVIAPGGYAVNTTAEPLTPTPDKKIAEWKCKNERTVSIQITKTDSVTGGLLEGAKFGLFTAPDEKSKIAEASTDENGVVTFGGLDPNIEYYYMELDPPENYVITDGGFKPVTTGSTDDKPTVEVPVTNDRKATLKIHKTKAGGAAFKNVTFELIAVKDSTKDILADTNNLAGNNTQKTNSSGNAEFTNLTPGQYWLIETVPAGYETGKENGEYVVNAADGWKVVTYNNKEYFYKKVTVQPGQNIPGYTQKPENISNTPTKGKIQLKKYVANSDGSASSTPIGNVEFKIYSDKARTKLVTTVTTSSDESTLGTVTTAYLAPGKYYIEETRVPDGYVKSDKVYEVEVKAGETTAQVIANNKKGSFTINKVAAYAVDGSNTNGVVREPLTGAKFALYEYNAQRDASGLPETVDDSAIVKALDTGDQSSVTVDSLEPGIYWLRETEAPDGYEKAEDSLVQVYADGSVKFAEWVDGKTVDELTWVSKTNKTITVDNFSENPRIRLIKTAYNSPATLLNGARFEVYVQAADGTPTDVDGVTVNLKTVYNDGTFVETDENEPLILESGTARNPDKPSQSVAGNALTPELEAGHTYYFKEIKAPVKDANGNKVSYHYDPDDVWQSVEIPAGATGEYRVTFVNYPDVTAPGTKYGPDGKTALSGAVMVIFDNEADANAMLNRLRNDYNEITNPLTQTIVNANKDAWHIDEIAVSGSNGIFNFANLIPGKTYYIIEAVAPNNYQMDKDASGNYFYYKVVVADTIGKGNPFSQVYKGTELLENTYTLSVINYAEQQIWLDKKVVVSGAEYWVDGAQFTIYPTGADGKPDTTKAVDTMKVSQESLPGRFLSGYLPAGTYWLRETTVPEGFVEADRDVVNSAFGENAQDSIIYNGARYYKVVLGRETDNTWFMDNPVYNVAEYGMFALTKIDSVTENNVEAKFKVELIESDDETEFTSFEFETPESGYYLSDYLPAGLYKLTEVSVEGDYTELKDPIYIRVEGGKITDGTVTDYEMVDRLIVVVYQPTDNVETTGGVNPTLKNSIVVENVPQGKFYIEKTGTWNGGKEEDLAYVAFDIYNKTSGSFENDKKAGAIKTIITNSEGIADSGILDAGEYWVIETGFIDSADELENADDLTDEQKEAINKYIAAKSAEYIKTSYTEFAVTVTAGQTSKTDDNTREVINISNYGKFEVTKVDSVDTSKKISGVTFAIYDNAQCTGTPVGVMTDNKDGTYTSPKLPTGKDYYLKETAAPNDYTINVGKISGPYTVTANTLTVEQTPIKNEHDKSFTVYKYEKDGDTETTKKVTGAEFGLYNTQAEAEAATSADPGNPIGEVKKTANGSITWNDLADGTYYLKELSAPSKYLMQDSKDFVATENNPSPNIYKIVINGKNGDSFAYSQNVYNLLKGGFELDKVILWANGETTLPGKNITFDLYKNSVAEGNKLTGKDGLTTNSAGKISYLNSLPAGDYILVERDATVDGIQNAYNKPADAPDTDNDGNYIKDGNIHIRILPSQTNVVFTGTNAVVNNANYGKFMLYKKTYTTDDRKNSKGINGAEYQLDRYDENEKKWIPMGTIAVNDGEWSNGVYESGALAQGKYRVTEVAPPHSDKNDNNVEVEFIVDPEPIEFTVSAASTVEVTQFDGIYRNLIVTKKTDSRNGSQPLEGVTFELYHASDDADLGEYAYDGEEETLAEYVDAENDDIIGTATTGGNGVVSFNKLEPGKYVLVETAVPDGYEKKIIVIEIDESLSYNDVEHEHEVVNASKMGRIIIRKEDADGELITQNRASNAQFAIYAEDYTESDAPLCTVSVDNTGYATTTLLPGERYYWVVETKAPDGFTLDGRLTLDGEIMPLKKLVYVTGDQNPEVDFTVMDKNATRGYIDGVIFQNREQSAVYADYASIQKLVRIKGETGYNDDLATSTDSLMFEDVTVEFKITNLTSDNVKNEIPFEKFIVTDESLKFMDKVGNEITAIADPTSDDYVMNKVTVGQATNKDTAKHVSAEVFAKVGDSDAEWQSVTVVDLSAGAQEVALPNNAIAFKVEYSNTDVGFSADDIIVEVTFKQRPSDPDVPQVRKIENTAVLNWEDTSLDRNGDAAHQFGEVSDKAVVAFPAYDDNLPTLALKNDVVNKPSSGMYYSGGTIDFETVGAVPATSPADLEHPVMSINLPPYTTLDTTKYSELEGGINGVRATLSDGTVCTFKITKITEKNANDQPYEKYVLDFGEDFVLPKNETITLEYTANIALNVPNAVIAIESRGFIGSGKQLPMTAENPTGMSYRQADSDGSTVVSNDVGFDAGLTELGNTIDGGELTYLRRPVHVELTRSDSRLIRKYVSVDRENWLTSEVPVVKPGDTYYYKLTLVNGGDPVRRIRMIDIMPFDGDTQEFRAMEGGTVMGRATELPSGEGYEQVELISVAPQNGENLNVTVYYYVESEDVTEDVTNRDWTAANRSQKTSTKELPMLTSNAPAKDVWAGWTTTPPADMRSVTAIGVEVEYLNGESLDGGEDYSVELTMRAPGYTAEKMNEYADAVIANTTAATVTGVRTADTAAVTAIDRVSSNEVLVKLYITTGAIGDYAFYDNNDNGIQDEGDIPARNIPVTLYRRKSTTTMTEEPQWEVYKTTYTDQTTGKYWFDKLPCNYLEPGKQEGSTDPADYIGNAYFEYRVEFGIPDGYAATIREAGNDRAVDSNINEFGVTDPITLDLTVNNDGKLEGEINPTIDAGYVKLVNLGDYVWIDYNKNGVQDESEIGLNGATVNLYKLESAEDTIEGKTPYRTQLTDTKDGKDGYYLFSDLPKGYYVVEFDISTVEKHTGYTTQYSFTLNDAGSDGADSDAAFVKDDNDQVMYTETIHLTEDDMTWDAGVTVYSALGGFVFDDQDYNDTQSIPTEVGEGTTANGIPLPGTVVTLYKVNEDGSMDPEPIAKRTVGADGRYLFDKLDAGRYRVHFDYPGSYIGVNEGVGDYLHDSETKFFDDSTLNSGFSNIIDLPADTADLTHDAGAYLMSSIGDYVWEDLDRDGIQDEDEKGVKDITVTLQQKLGDGEWTTIETTTTDENGLYMFEGLKSSDHYDVQYRVAFAIPLTVVLTGDNIGENRAEDSNALPTLDAEYGYFTNEVKPPYGEDDLTIDAGLYYKDELCEVGDYVWYDDNRDGIQDEDEKGVEGIEVVLERCESDDIWDEEAWIVVATTTTDADGKYIFKGLQPGRYRVAFGLKEPWIVTVSRVGDVALDSDAIRQSGDYYYTSAFFLNAGDSDMTWDAGIYKPQIVTPPTGDNSLMFVWLTMLLSSMTALIILIKKLKKDTI